MENIADSPIIADTSALVSLATDTDHNHIPAKEAAAQLREGSRPIILPADIFVETSRFAHFFRSSQNFNTLNSWDLYDYPILEES
jgi:predicted nucleic acid-binding protein